MRARWAGGCALLVAGALAGCGGGGGSGTDTSGAAAQVQTVVQVANAPRRGLDAESIYKHEAPGVVTVISIYSGGDLPTPTGSGGDNSAALGSGFVLNGKGEIATNAHVVTDGTGSALKRAREVYVQFQDGNQVPAKIVGTDANSDVALLSVAPAGLTLRPLPLGASHGLVVGQPVAAIGSPFGERESISEGIVSGLNRSIDSLNTTGQTGFSISGAIQTDAAINHGNSGGPLVDGAGRVIGINSQIQSTGGGGEGVGFAVPVDTVRRSLDQLRAKGHVDYAYLGVSTIDLFPQLAKFLHVPVSRGALIEQVSNGGPGAHAGLHAGGSQRRFQATQVRPGGDVIVSVAGKPVRQSADVSAAIADLPPGRRVSVGIFRGGKRQDVQVTLGQRPTG